MGDGAEQSGAYASPPCFLHELDPGYLGFDGPRLSPEEVGTWRKGERERLIAARLAIAPPARAAMAERIASLLDIRLGEELAGRVVSLFWPFRGEPDLRGWMEAATRRGARCALPVVVARHAPLAFRRWRAGEPLDRGVWNIPVPRDGETVTPDVVIAPLVGFDPHRFRLGYGGGYYDRTLAALSRRPLVVGVGYSEAAIPTIHPQLHDVAMDVIITENGILTV